MKKIILHAGCFILLHLHLSAQQIHLNSLQHTIRWLDETRFPNYVSMDTTRDYILLETGAALKKHFNLTDVTLPSGIDYHAIIMFG